MSAGEYFIAREGLQIAWRMVTARPEVADEIVFEVVAQLDRRELAIVAGHLSSIARGCYEGLTPERQAHVRATVESIVGGGAP